MSDYKQVVKSLFRSNDVRIAEEHANVFDQFLKAEENQLIVEKIGQCTTLLMDNWRKDQRIRKIMEHSLRIPNATVGKFYDVPFGQHPVLEEVSSFEWKGLDSVGLQYDSLSGKISGTPNQSGEIKLLFCFKFTGNNDDSPFHEKEVILTVNPDPKSLWKNIQSNRDDPNWKEDNITVFDKLSEKNILVSSKRGRSHANIGSFREDDFAFENYENGWSLVAVADGAGSAKASRKGSALACQTLVKWFGEQENLTVMSSFDDLLKQYTQQQESDDSQKEVNRFVYNNLGKAALAIHKKLDAFASGEGLTLKDLSTTLIFVLMKKYEYGYAVMSFGVGDCPIAILNEQQDKIILMNWIDVGEYGGGTRFITMPEIFKNQDFSTRFGFKLIDDFSYLFLMSDGIYDPKFVVEVALEDVSKWKEFIADLEGNNPEKLKVQLDKNNQQIEQQLSAWMDFWSPGNHDDRTLAIVF